MSLYCAKCGTTHDCSVCPKCHGFGLENLDRHVMTDELKAEREDFNKWAEKGMDMDYKWQYAHPVFRDRLNIAWEAWQARAQLDRTHTTGGDWDE